MPLLFFSCGKQSHWAFDQVHSEKKEYCSTKLSYYAKDPIHGIDLEFLQTEQHLNVYLNIHSIPVPPYRGNPKSALVTLEIAGEKLFSEAYRLEGGQRFLLPQEIADTLTWSLQSGQTVTLSLGTYRSTIAKEDFPSKFDQLQHPFPLQNPFRLPL